MESSIMIDYEHEHEHEHDYEHDYEHEHEQEHEQEHRCAEHGKRSQPEPFR